ncbi:Protein of unknown function [Cotesia congregata]|uniref:Uncharacterized protein n=1 Tax=Cotesia congregata TaxID=51543 RepID=A0A8J2HBF7_COTCN|nr:Protein of unknown function [Cotesia congregata]
MLTYMSKNVHSTVFLCKHKFFRMQNLHVNLPKNMEFTFLTCLKLCYCSQLPIIINFYQTY